MPKKKELLSDDERAKRIREAAQQAEVDNDPASFERAFAVVASAKKQEPQPKQK